MKSMLLEPGSRIRSEISVWVFLHFCNETWGYTFNYAGIFRRGRNWEIFGNQLTQPIANDPHL